MTQKFKEGDRVTWNGSQGTFLRYDTDKEGREIGILKWDEDKDNDIEQEDLIEYIKPLVLLTIEDVAEVTMDPQYAPFGAVIGTDGMCYVLRQQWAHGIVCAILFPELAHAQGYAAPARGAANVYHYQRFELDNHEDMPVIRIAFGFAGRVMSTSQKAATPAQIEGARRCMIASGVKLNDEVQTDYRASTLRAALKLLAKDRDER